MIVDLHCDLLSHPSFSCDDAAVRCAPDQLISGGVKQQVCAIFMEHGKGSPTCSQQNALFFSLSQDPRITLMGEESRDASLCLIRGIENGSVLGEDTSPLEQLLRCLHALHQQGPIAYLGLVWNGRNRFGGGILDPYRLTDDGKQLLQLMAALGIPADLSHCCDHLVHDILDYTIDRLPELPVLASHSNFRTVHPAPRNLLDAHAKEIAARGGLIGLNLVRYFVGNCLEAIYDHIAHADTLSVSSQLVLGTDLFYSNEPKFFPEFATACDYPYLVDVLNSVLSPEEVLQLTYCRASHFLERISVNQAVLRDRCIL